jgi:hypothetical protein
MKRYSNEVKSLLRELSEERGQKAPQFGKKAQALCRRMAVYGVQVLFYGGKWKIHSKQFGGKEGVEDLSPSVLDAMERLEYAEIDDLEEGVSASVLDARGFFPVKALNLTLLGRIVGQSYCAEQLVPKINAETASLLEDGK